MTIDYAAILAALDAGDYTIEVKENVAQFIKDATPSQFARDLVGYQVTVGDLKWLQVVVEDIHRLQPEWAKDLALSSLRSEVTNRLEAE